jgi:hypothetical protein
MSSIEGFLRINADGDMWQQQKLYHNNDGITFRIEKISNCTFTRGFPATSSNDLALAIKRARVTAIKKAAIDVLQ